MRPTKDTLSSRIDFYLILALGPRNGLSYCVINGHKVIGDRIIVIIIIIIVTLLKCKSKIAVSHQVMTTIYNVKNRQSKTTCNLLHLLLLRISYLTTLGLEM